MNKISNQNLNMSNVNVMEEYGKVFNKYRMLKEIKYKVNFLKAK